MFYGKWGIKMNWTALVSALLTLFVPIGLICLLFYLATATGLIGSITVLTLLVVGIIACFYFVYDEEDDEE